MVSSYPDARKNGPEVFSYASLSPSPWAARALSPASAPRPRVSGFGFSPGSCPASGARAVFSQTLCQCHVSSRRTGSDEVQRAAPPTYLPTLRFRSTWSWYYLLNAGVTCKYAHSLFIRWGESRKLSLWWQITAPEGRKQQWRRYPPKVFENSGNLLGESDPRDRNIH